MMKYLYCELLKTKHTFSRKLIIIAPITTIVLAFLMGGPYNFQAMSIYWWNSFILYGYVAIQCGLSIQREQRSGKFYSIYSMPINLSKFWITKVLVIALLVLAASIFLSILVGIITLLGITPQPISHARVFLSALAEVISCLWQIPLCLWLSNKVSIYASLLINTILGLVLSFVSITSFWWIAPYTWNLKIIEPITGIKSSGEMALFTDYSVGLIPIIIGMSLVLLLVLVFMSIKWFVNQEVK